MKRFLYSIVIFALVFSLCLSLTACVKEKDKPTGNTTASTTTAKDKVTTAPDTSDTGDTSKPSDTSKPQDTTSKPSTDSTTGETKPQTPPDISSGVDGIIRSDSGTSLNLVLSYRITETDEGKSISVEIGLDTYAVYASARTNKLTIDGEYYTYKSDAVRYDGDAKTYIKLHEATYSIDSAAGEIPISAEWNFRGEYAGTSIEALKIDAVIKY